jgi:hypothetical protein
MDSVVDLLPIAALEPLSAAMKPVRNLIALLSKGEEATESAPTEPLEDDSRVRNLDRARRELDRLEITISEIARASPDAAAQYQPSFISRCNALVRGLERNRNASPKNEVLESIGRLEIVLLQFQDIVDPYLECILCAEAFHTSQFPERVTASCTHQVKTCSGCLTQWVGHAMSERGFAQLKCLECNQPLASEDIRAIASPETFQR